MVSYHRVSVTIAALLIILPALAQSVDIVPDETRRPAQATGTQPTTTLPTRELTPERRGDIFMARKMYREAVEMYKQAPRVPCDLEQARYRVSSDARSQHGQEGL